jgi:hypothetical protein
MSQELVLDPLTEYLQSLDQPLGYSTISVQDAEHPVLDSLLKDWAKKDEQFGNFTVPFGEMVVDGGYLRHRQDKHQAFPIDMVASRELGMALDIPTKYLDRIAGTELFAGNVNHWLDKFSDHEATIVFNRGEGTVNEILDADVFRKRLPRADVVRVISDIVGDDTARVRSVIEGARKTVIRVSSPLHSVCPERRVGDITEAGLMLTLPKGIQAPVVSVYLHRLVCTNGMTKTDNKLKVEIKGLDSKEIIENIRTMGSLVWARAQKMLHGLAVLDDEVIENPRYMAGLFAREMGMNARTQKYAEDLISDFVDFNRDYRITRYDLVQLMTAITHDPRVKQAARDAIEEGAGNMVAIATEEHRCDSCHQLVPDRVQHEG